MITWLNNYNNLAINQNGDINLRIDLYRITSDTVGNNGEV